MLQIKRSYFELETISSPVDDHISKSLKSIAKVNGPLMQHELKISSNNGGMVLIGISHFKQFVV